MNKEKLLNLGLNEELAEKVLKEFENFIPKSRFDEVNEAKKQALQTIKERDEQLETLKKSSLDVDNLKAEIEKLQETNKNAETEYNRKLNELKLNSIVDMALNSSGARNIKAVKSLLNLENAEIENDSIKGLADQIKALKDSDSYLFNVEQPKQDNIIQGMKQLNSNVNADTKPVNQMTYADWCKALENK